MLVTRLFTLLMFMNTFIFATAYADDADKKDALSCLVNRSESLTIVQDDERVVYVPFLKPSTDLDLTEFKAFRCPFCFRFSGKANGRTWAGGTRGSFNSESKKWTISLNLTIDGVQKPEIGCEQTKI